MKAGDTITFSMLKSKNGCLFPASAGDKHPDLDCEAIEGEVISIDHDMAEVKYFCEKCNRFFVTTVMIDNK